MTFDKKLSLRKAAMATVLAGAVLGAASLPAAARGYVSFGYGGPTYYSYGPSYYAPSYGYSYYAPPPAYYYPPPAPVYAAPPPVSFGFHFR